MNIKDIIELDKEEIEKLKEIYDEEYHVEFEYFDDHGDYRAEMTEDDETFSSLQSLAKWAINRKNRDNNFKILYIKKMKDIPDDDLEKLESFLIKAKIDLEAKEKEEKKKFIIKKEKEKEKRRKIEYQHYLNLKKKYEKTDEPDLNYKFSEVDHIHGDQRDITS